MDIYELQRKRRTIRKFQDRLIPHDLLVKFIDYARFTPSGMNRQPVKYKIVDDPTTVAAIFPHTRWAGALKGKGTPSFDQRPRAFILLLIDQTLAKQSPKDAGAAAQAIQLMAEHEGIGCCWMGAIDRNDIALICNLPERYIIDTLLSLGYPAQQPVSEEMLSADYDYYLDESGTLHVPKRPLDEVLIP